MDTNYLKYHRGEQKIKSLYNKQNKVKNLSERISKELKIPLSNQLIKQVNIFLNNQNYKKLYITYNEDYNKIDAQIIKNYMNLLENNSKEKYIDVHELNKQNVLNNKNLLPSGDYHFSNTVQRVKKQTNVSNVSNVSNVKEPVQNNIVQKSSTELFNNLSIDEKLAMVKIINRPSILREGKIFLDSRYRDLSVTETNKISFSLINNSRAMRSLGGVAVITGKNVRDIVKITVPKFTIPYIKTADNYYNKISLSFVELLADAYHTYENGDYHFMFSATKNGNLIELTPDDPTYEFFEPISYIERLTLRFGSPIGSFIDFNKDRLYIQSVDYASNPGEITFAEEHNLVTEDIIYIKDFTSLTPSIDSEVLAEINSSNGHIINEVSTTTISIPIDFNRITNPNINQIVEVYFGSKRIMIPLKIKYEMNNKED